MLSRCRAFFAARDVLEVETPLLSRAGATDPNIRSLQLDSDSYSGMYLNTSPEFAMKRLLAAGSGDIFQICKAFRSGEQGRQHNPEFTLIEWYREGFHLPALMREVADLLVEILQQPALAGQAMFIPYAALFEQQLGLNPLDADVSDLAACLQRHGVECPDGESNGDDLLDLIMSTLIVPALDGERLCFIYDYPVSQAALARAHPGNPALAKRFEAVLGGMELANGFEELTDPVEQRARFTTDCRRRAELGMPRMPVDERLLAALASGIGDCSGVALGLDRVLMLKMRTKHIEEVLSFPVATC